MSTKHIIWNKARGLPTVAHDDLQTALEEAKRLANLQPHDVFEVYSHAATVYGEVKVNVQIEGQSAAPLSPDVAPVKPDYYPHLRPVPPELLPLPEGAVYLGRGGEFDVPSKFFEGWAKWKLDDKSWSGKQEWEGTGRLTDYCAPADSEIVRLNREGSK